jgi:hypothetical protein
MTEKVTKENWELKDKLEKIISNNCKEIPYEGTEINKYGIIEDIMELLDSKEYLLQRHTKN